MSASQLFIGIRKGNGQIGYLSESLSIPEFFELVRPKEASNQCTLVDFSPVIRVLHDTHNQQVERSIRAEYNAVYNYWQDAASFSDKAIILSKSEGLAKSSNDFLTKMDFRIDEKLAKYCHRRTGKISDNYYLVEEISSDVDAYIDILLCFVHSKASLEIASFKNDFVLTQYIASLVEKVKKLYFNVVEYNEFSDDIDRASLLYYLALHKNADVNSYLRLIPAPHSDRDLIIELIEKAKENNMYGELNVEMSIRYRFPDHMELEMAKLLRNLLMKAHSLAKLVELLKTKEVEWDSSTASVNELAKLIEK